MEVPARVRAAGVDIEAIIVGNGEGGGSVVNLRGEEGHAHRRSTRTTALVGVVSHTAVGLVVHLGLQHYRIEGGHFGQ